MDGSSFEDILSEISTAFVRASAEAISHEIERSLRLVVLALEIDRATVGQLDPADGLLYATHQWAREGVVPIPRALNAAKVVPWLTGKLLAGQPVVLAQVEEAPVEAARDLEYARSIGSKSTVAIPFKIGTGVVGTVVFDAVTRARTWSARTLQRLRLIAEVFGTALERERAAAELSHVREEMRRASRVATMGELTASLAHELNQPLGAILNNAQAARRFLAAREPELGEVRAAIDEIIQDNSRAVETIRAVRALFQRDQLDMAPLDLRQVLLDVERMLKFEAVSKRIVLRLDLPTSLSSVVGNRIQLVELLMNLTLNAFDSVCDKDDGIRTVDLRAGQRVAQCVNVAVADSGKGIDPKIMPLLFNPFFSTKPGGMGMGLTIARSIVETHGGRLWASSNPDGGAIMEFELPAIAHE